MPLELDSLRNAIISLGLALDRSEDAGTMQNLDAVLQTAIQAGAIKHFEFTYELCWKFINRWLEHNVSPNAADGVTRRELFRMGMENRLI